VFKGCPSFPIAHIFVEKQIRHGCDNRDVGIKCLQKYWDTPDQFCQLKTGKCPGNSNEAIEYRWVKTALASKTGYQERADPIRTVKIENPFFVKQNSRKEVVREPWHFRATVIECQGARR
jgi:hypothetical protein